MVIRHVCGECRRPVRNPRGLEWTHVGASGAHRVRDVQTVRVDEAPAKAA